MLLLVLFTKIWKQVVQVNFCQKHLFLDQLTRNMTKDCSLIYQFSTWKLQAQNMLCTQFFLFWHSGQFMYTTCSELVVCMYWTGKSMNNLFSYCGLVDVRINASDKDLPVITKWTGPERKSEQWTFSQKKIICLGKLCSLKK